MDAQHLTNQFHLDVYNRYPLTLVSGKGPHVWDEDGNKYLDALAGIAVNSLGHCHPGIVKAVREQVGQLMHISNFYYSKPQAKLVEKLAEISGLDRAFLCNSGAEAMEGAIKLARKYGQAKNKKGPLITVSNAFHGRTMGTISMGMEKYSRGYAPLLPGFDEVPFNDVKALKSAFNKQTLGIVLEPIQGSGGLTVASQEFMKTAEKLCRNHNSLLIVDEVQTGIGRTGRMFGFQHYDVSPDIIALAKAMGGGFPIGAMLSRDHVAETMNHGEHGSTYGGNPLACAASLAALEVVIDENLVEQAKIKGQFLHEKITEHANLIPQIKDVRGLGLMLGVELSFPCREVVRKMMESGVLANCTQGNIIRLVPPLVTPTDDLQKLVATLIKAIKEVIEENN